MKLHNVILTVLVALVLSSCTVQEEEVDGTALTRLAQQVKATGVVEKLEAMDGRLVAMDKKLEALERKVESGVRVAAPADTTAPDGTDGDKAAVDVVQPEPETRPAGKPPEFKLTYEPPSTVRLVVWHSYRGKEKTVFEKLCRDFSAAYPKFDMEPQEVPFSALRDKLVVTIPRGEGPDLFIYAHNNIGDWLLKGDILVPLSTYIEQFDSFEALDRFMPDTVKALAYDGTIYGYPMAYKSHALFYNKALVKKAPATVDELIEMASAVMTKVDPAPEEEDDDDEDDDDDDDDDRIFGLVYDSGLLYNHALWVQAFGSRIMDEKGNALIDTPEMIKAANLVRTFVTPHGILPNLDDSMATFLFNANQVAFVIKGPWFLGEIDEGVDYGVAVLPEVATGKPGTPFLGSEGVFLSHCSQNKDAAFQFLRYVTSYESAAQRLVDGSQPVPNLAVYEDKSLVARADPALEVFRKQAENTVIMSSRPAMQAVWSTVDNALRKVIFGGADAAQVMKQAQAKVDHDIAGMGK